MLIAEERHPFDDPDWLFELKLAGGRCLAYLDKDTVLVSRRSVRVLSRFPEFSGLHKQVKAKCILDGELVAMKGGVPDFEDFQKRSVLNGKLRIRMASLKMPVTFVAHDILYCSGDSLMELPLMERKYILPEVVREDEKLAISRYVEDRGIDFFNLTTESGLEGIIAKKKGSLYRPGIRTREWVKIKNVMDDDFVVCGYIRRSGSLVTIILGQYDERLEMVYKGHVVLAASSDDFKLIGDVKTRAAHPFAVLPDADNSDAIWLEPMLVCKVQFMSRTSGGLLRQPVYRGLRMDKTPDEARHV